MKDGFFLIYTQNMIDKDIAQSIIDKCKKNFKKLAFAIKRILLILLTLAFSSLFLNVYYTA